MGQVGAEPFLMGKAKANKPARRGRGLVTV